MRSIRQAITDGVQPRVIEAMIGIGNVEELRDTEYDQTVLMYAIEKRAAPAIICMLAQNMDAGSLSKTSLCSRTALMMAIDSRLDADVIRAIAQNMDAAGLSQTCFRGRTALMMAIDSRLDADVIRAIAQNMDAEGLSATCPRGRTALMMAYRQADPATILALTEPRGRGPYAATERQNRGNIVPRESARDSLLRPYRPVETVVPPAYTPRQHEGELPPAYEEGHQINHTNEARSQEDFAADPTNVAEVLETREGASLGQGGSYLGALGLFADLAGIYGVDISSGANLVWSESSRPGLQNRSP